jgi:hypothetical protein
VDDPLQLLVSQSTNGAGTAVAYGGLQAGFRARVAAGSLPQTREARSISRLKAYTLIENWAMTRGQAKSLSRRRWEQVRACRRSKLCLFWRLRKAFTIFLPQLPSCLRSHRGSQFLFVSEQVSPTDQNLASSTHRLLRTDSCFDIFDQAFRNGLAQKLLN